MNSAERIGHLGHNRPLLCIGHHDIGHGGRLISFGCRCGSGLCLGGSHRHGADDSVIVVARIPIPIGLTLVLSLVCIPRLNLANRSRRCAVEHVVFTLFDRVRSGLADQTMWPVRALES